MGSVHQHTVIALYGVDRRRTRTEAIAKHYAFHAKTINLSTSGISFLFEPDTFYYSKVLRMFLEFKTLKPWLLAKIVSVPQSILFCQPTVLGDSSSTSTYPFLFSFFSFRFLWFFIISSFLTLPHLLDCFICARNAMSIVLLLQMMGGWDRWGVVVLY